MMAEKCQMLTYWTALNILKFAFWTGSQPFGYQDNGKRLNVGTLVRQHLDISLFFVKLFW